MVPVTAAEGNGEREKLVQASGCGAACGGAAWALQMCVLQSHGGRESPEGGHQRLKTLAFCSRAPVPQRKPRQGPPFCLNRRLVQQSQQPYFTCCAGLGPHQLISLFVFPFPMQLKDFDI